MRRLLLFVVLLCTGPLAASTWVTSNPYPYIDQLTHMQKDANNVYLGGNALNGSFKFEARVEMHAFPGGALVGTFGSGGAISISSTVDSYLLTGLLEQGSSLYVSALRSITYATEVRIEKRDLLTGALDPGFGTGGALTLPYSAGKIASDGSALFLVGSYGAATNTASLIERRDLATGALDGAFGVGGQVLHDVNSGLDRFTDVVASGGTLTVVGMGSSTTYTAYGLNEIERRSATSGALDGSFAGGGITQTSVGSYTGITADASAYYLISNQGNGADTSIEVEKIDKTTGAYVSAFGGSGFYTQNPGPYGDGALSYLLEGAGGLYISVLDWTSSTDSEWRVFKLSTATGALDSSFASGGIYTLNPTASAEGCFDLFLDSGSLYVGGYDYLAGIDSEWRVEQLSTGPAPTNTPSPTASATLTPSPFYSPSSSPSASATPSVSPVVSATSTPTASSTRSATPSYTASPSCTITPTPVAAYSSPYTDDFEAGSPGWSATGLWHSVDTGSANPYALAFSGTHSWWYGQDSSGTYDTGVANSGTLTSPPILISGSPTLSFESWYQTESNTTSWDTRWVQISVNGGPFNNLQQLSGDAMLTWLGESISLAAYNGSTVQIRFAFNTIDATSNAFRGWYVDKLLVGPAPTPTSSPTATPSLTCTRSATISPTFSVSPSFSASPTVNLTPGCSSFGQAALLSNNNDTGNYIIGSRYTLSAPMTVQSLSLYAYAGSSGFLRLGIYSNGAGNTVGTLLVDSGSQPISASPGWITLSVASTPLAAGDYWLAFNNQGNLNLGFNSNLTPSTECYYASTYAAFPSNYTPTGYQAGGCSILANGCPLGSPTSTQTPTGSPTLTRTPSPTPTPTASVTGSPGNSPTASLSPTVTPSPVYADVRSGKLFSYPNPFKLGPGRHCTFRFHPCGTAKIELYDIAARRVGEISADDVDASNGVAFWDGRLYNNAFAAPGLYFALLRSDDGILNAKFTVIR